MTILHASSEATKLVGCHRHQKSVCVDCRIGSVDCRHVFGLGILVEQNNPNYLIGTMADRDKSTKVSSSSNQIVKSGGLTVKVRQGSRDADRASSRLDEGLSRDHETAAAVVS